MHPVGQIALRELHEGAGKRGLGRNLCASFPTTDAAQRFVGAKAIDESAGGGNAEHGLGDEGARQAASILGRPAGSSRRLGNEGLEADHIENGDEPPEQFGHRLDFLTHTRKQGALDMIPTRPHGVERIGHGFCRGACCLIRNHNKIILKRNSNILNTLLATIEFLSIYIAHLKPVPPIILQEALGHKEVLKIVRKHPEIHVEELQCLPFAIALGEYREGAHRECCVTIFYNEPIKNTLYIITTVRL